MKKILLVSLICVMAAALPWAAKGHTGYAEGEEYSTKTVQLQTELTGTEQTGWTIPVPSDYLQESAHGGSIQEIRYNSRDYAGNGEPITKKAMVYLPYGYDENDAETRYNILYLMHGWGGYAGDYFASSYIPEILDHMIENGDIEPLIVVSATFYNENSGTDFGNSVAELRAFHQDFEENLMPAVESTFHTYAMSTSDADLRASRDHRAFGGFSLGSVTTWQIFVHDYDYVRYFLPMSGSSWYYGGYGDFQTVKNVDYIEQLVEENDLDERGYFIYHAVGTRDSVKYQTVAQAEEMLARNDVFTPDHYVFCQKNGGIHDFNAAQEFIYNALPLFFGARNTESTVSETEDDSMAAEKYYDTGSRITDVMNDPAFEEYGRLLFPVNGGYYSGNTLGNLSLTWYSHIDPDKTVEIVNYLKKHALAGEQVFYDIYSDEEKAVDPSKKNTGLFFFKGEPGERFAICNAGGGMVYVGAMHDSFPHALELSKLGYNAFALIYRPGYDTAPADLARAIAFIHEHAEELEVDVTDYSLWGGSAGARMAAWLGSYSTDMFGEAEYPRPAAVIMQYTGLSEIYGNEPATYNCVGTSDGIASYRTMQRRIDALKANGVDTMIEVFPGLPHGFGLGTGTVAEGWLNNAVTFWEKQIRS